MILHNKKFLFYQYILGSLDFCSRMNYRIPHQARLPYIHKVPCAVGYMCRFCKSHYFLFNRIINMNWEDYVRIMVDLTLGCIWELGFAAWQRTQ